MPQQRAASPDSAPPWTIRRATVDDAEAIETVRVVTWKACYRGYLPDAYLDSLTVTASRVEQYRQAIEDVESAERVIANSGAEVIGMGFAGPPEDAELDASVGELYALYVLPGWQGRGVGRALLDRLTAGLRARGYSSAILWALRDLPPTRRFYESNGWAFDGTQATHDWHGPVHLVRYARDLSTSA